MGSYSMQQSYYRPTPLTVDTSHAQKYFEEEDGSILDDNILDHSAIDSGLEMSPPMVESRRDSFAVSSSLFSPKTEDWQSVDMQSVPSNNPFFEPQQHSNNPFMQHQQAPFVPQGHSWSIGNGSGSCTPLQQQQFDGLPADYESQTALFQRPLGQTPFSNPSNQVNLFSSAGANNTSVPTSPQKEWNLSKKNSSATHIPRSHNELRRGDGIRKKNARFDIPAERNLNNIDQLIAQSTDEQEIKELKQQKRLLRNRQAALDSRQRKKQHTERLEDEKKHFNALISDMDEEVAALKAQVSQLMAEKQQYTQYIDSMNMEKDEMIRAHTVETGELRKRVSVLTENVQRLENAAVANSTGSSSGFHGDFDGIDSLQMDGQWDHMQLFDNFPMEPAEVKQETQLVQTKKNESAIPADAEKSSQGGLLFMLFLVGAFVLSSRSTPNLPRVSEDMRAASQSLLENVLKDAGVPQSSAAAPQPSGSAWAPSQSMPIAAPMESVAPSMLGELADSLTQPTEQQANEQLFGLTPAEYNNINSHDYLNTAPQRSTSQGRRNLADSLAAMRNNNKGSAAEVYTRSLLWDQIPQDVVKNFVKMVGDCNTLQGDDAT